MADVSKISNSEWEIMKYAWDNIPCTANEIVGALSKITDWKSNTIRTLINRLIKKEVLGYKIDEKDKKTYYYFPLLSENECIKAESDSFIKRVFNGSLNGMIANFLKESELSDEDIEELKNILDKKKG
ncbi:BlaI/MecI/CopY family transcriptional regulator [Clostridium tagluense]|uniref:BlaI/MecI/CopY family transcriptional regulator n=1 Tax=Clostridium tagluense TaxID=360422 RepID=UPI001C6E86BD|nr:BlaI/MecI/CopY family transcriptional regulator [Clostridium tagluense]MBW9157257.1 BlaI/MecI/CopY family transcriptional regulator [Clostridium tagluense]MCB2310951.1 BlaI/MecI/CopY family transcriptional regulator [Clostridium tagluense]MCB2315805.1 BlaI/MecI/CopY family transcriptional regulator [Clostridium tagluense]MCB2320551.1 BlaI/MecI/CopY family transcriptional regulator [Clostridium tagluense]MCB2325544.1 BlaI/MecI/CopY family transcriptional regulator [Clostridium tagluense]